MQTWLTYLALLGLVTAVGCTTTVDDEMSEPRTPGSGTGPEDSGTEDSEKAPPVLLDPISGKEEYFRECGDEDPIALYCPVFRVRVTNNADHSLDMDKEKWTYLGEDGNGWSALYYEGPDAIMAGGSSVVKIGVEKQYSSVVHGLMLSWSQGEEVTRAPHFGKSCENRVCEFTTHTKYPGVAENDLRWTVDGDRLGTGSSVQFEPPQKEGNWTVKLTVPMNDRAPTYTDVVSCSEDRGCS